MRKFISWLLVGALLSPTVVSGQTTLQHAAKVQAKPNGSTTYIDTMRIWGGLQAGAGGAVQVINQDGTINATQIPAGSITFSMWDDNGCSSGQIPKYNGSAWVCDTDIVGGGGGGGTLSSISLVMPSAIFDISPGTLTADGSFTVTFDTQTANYIFAGPTTGAAAAPTFRAMVAADLPTAVLLSSDNEVITGDWRFSTNTVFGDAVTPQNLIHIYKASTQSGISIEKGDETERWDILANTSGLQIKEATSGNNLLTFKNNRIGILNNSPTAGYEVDLTGDLKLSGNISLGSYFENSLIPATGDTYNIGDITRPWAQAWISQINATIFAEATATIFGGYSIVGRNAGSTTAAIASGDTTIYLDKNGTSLPVSGDTWILIKSYDASGSTTPSTEYIRLISVGSCTGSGATLSCPWSVQRDVTSLHATDPAWNIGTPFMFLGSNGDGRIEFYSVSGLPRISILRQSTTAASSTDIVRLGGLDGVAGMSSVTGRYGVFIGEGTTNYLKFQKKVDGSATVGDDDTLIVQGTIRAIAGKFGSDATNYVGVDTNGLDVGTGVIHGGKATATSTSDGFWFGKSGGTGNYIAYMGTSTEYFKWDGSDLSWAGNNTSLTTGGLFTASNAVITGTITTSNINATGGFIGGWVLGASTLTADSLTVGLSSAGSGTALRFWAGDTIAGSPEFYVRADGYLSAVSGTIGGWTLSSSVLSANSATVGMSSAGSGTAIRFWAGDVLAGTPEFYVRADGYFSATSGTIGGWTLGATSLVAGSGGNTVGLDSGGTNPAFYAGNATPGSAPFRVTKTGALTAENATLYGTLTAGASVVDPTLGFRFSATDYCTGLAPPCFVFAADTDGFSFEFTGGATGGLTGIRKNTTSSPKNIIQLLSPEDLYVQGTGFASIEALPNGGVGAAAVFMTTSGGTGTMDLTATTSIAIDSTTLFVDAVNNYVGINDNTPTEPLDVVGVNNLYTAYFIGGATSGQSYGFLVDAGSTSADWTARFRNRAGADILAIRGDGRVGILNVSPTTALDVTGVVNATGFSSGGTAGISFTVNPTSCTSITVTNGLITAKSGC